MGWRRLGTSVGATLLSAAMLGTGVLVGGGGALAILVQDWSGAVKASWLALELVTAAVFVAFASRMLLVGTYVGDKGIRVRTPLRTLAFDWPAVLSIRSQKVTRAVSGPVLVVTARQVCVDLIDGQTIELPLHGALRDASRPWRMPDILDAAEFDRLVAELRHLTALQQTRHREQSPS